MFKKQIKVSHMSPRGAKKVQEFMVMERTITLTVGSHQKEFITTSTQRDDLVVGYLYLQGLDIEDKDIHWEEDHATIAHKITQKREPVSLGEGPQVSYQEICHLLSYFTEKAILYKDTSVTNSVALATSKEILYFAEDLEPDQAFYKVMSQAKSSQVDPKAYEGKVLITTGKVTVPWVEWCQQYGIPMIVSRFAPTDQAYERAQEANLTICGFARGTQFKVYTHKKRIS